MSISSIAASLWSSATTALSPNAATAPVSQSSTKPNRSGTGNGTTGSGNPFQALSPDLQSWLNQNQASNNATPMHRHHHRGEIEEAAQSYAASNALSAASGTQPAIA